MTYSYYYCIPSNHKYRFDSDKYMDDIADLVKEADRLGIEPEIEDSGEDWVYERDGEPLDA